MHSPASVSLNAHFSCPNPSNAQLIPTVTDHGPAWISQDHFQQKHTGWAAMPSLFMNPEKSRATKQPETSLPTLQTTKLCTWAGAHNFFASHLCLLPLGIMASRWIWHPQMQPARNWRGRHRSIVNYTATCRVSIPHGHQFESWLLHF